VVSACTSHRCPTAEQRTSKDVNHGVERDQGHLNQRRYCMRGFKQAASAHLIARGHARIRNLRHGCSTLTLPVPVNLRRAVAWQHVGQALYPCTTLPLHAAVPHISAYRPSCPRSRNNTGAMEQRMSHVARIGVVY
jgi:hypothetical protein